MAPENAVKTVRTLYRIRTRVGSQPSHSAKPPQTPPIMRLEDKVRAIGVDSPVIKRCRVELRNLAFGVRWERIDAG